VGHEVGVIDDAVMEPDGSHEPVIHAVHIGIKSGDFAAVIDTLGKRARPKPGSENDPYIFWIKSDGDTAEVSRIYKIQRRRNDGCIPPRREIASGSRNIAEFNISAPYVGRG
jgi:hypothetical protein